MLHEKLFGRDYIILLAVFTSMTPSQSRKESFSDLEISKQGWGEVGSEEQNLIPTKVWQRINCRNSPKIGRSKIHTDRLIPNVPASQQANESPEREYQIVVEGVGRSLERIEEIPTGIDNPAEL